MSHRLILIICFFGLLTDVFKLDAFYKYTVDDYLESVLRARHFFWAKLPIIFTRERGWKCKLYCDSDALISIGMRRSSSEASSKVSTTSILLSPSTSYVNPRFALMVLGVMPIKSLPDWFHDPVDLCSHSLGLDEFLSRDDKEGFLSHRCEAREVAGDTRANGDGDCFRLVWMVSPAIPRKTYLSNCVSLLQFESMIMKLTANIINVGRSNPSRR